MNLVIGQPTCLQVHVTRDMIEWPPSCLDPDQTIRYVPSPIRRCSINFDTTEDLPMALGVHPIGQRIGVYDKRHDLIWDGVVSECHMICGLWSVVLRGCVPRDYKPCWLCAKTTKFRLVKCSHVAAEAKTYRHLICTECECYTECEEA
jgi:hypothetical protein